MSVNANTKRLAEASFRQLETFFSIVKNGKGLTDEQFEDLVTNAEAAVGDLKGVLRDLFRDSKQRDNSAVSSIAPAEGMCNGKMNHKDGTVAPCKFKAREGEEKCEKCYRFVNKICTFVCRSDFLCSKKTEKGTSLCDECRYMADNLGTTMCNFQIRPTEENGNETWTFCAEKCSPTSGGRCGRHRRYGN